MTFVARLRERALAKRVGEEAAQYRVDSRDLEHVQLRRFNDGWRRSLAMSPWAREMQRRFDLPSQFATWAEFERLMPISRKSDLRQVIDDTDAPFPPVAWRATGGTTSEPFRFPVTKAEIQISQTDMWVGRSWLGVRPSDRAFLIWGHAHLFGVGVRGAMNRWRRSLSDRLLGYVRWSAYDLAEADLRAAGDALISSRARYVVGYASALDRFARANRDRAGDFAALKLSAAIATAEAFPRAESREEIAACLGCPTIMEYGAAETGPIAYEAPAGGFQVFWHRYRVEAAAATSGGSAHEIVLTSLFPRALPLLRYGLGDRFHVEGSSKPVLRLAGVEGRSNEAVPLGDGSLIHSEAFTHAIRDIPGVVAFQVVCRSDEPPIIRYEARAPISSASEDLIRGRLAKVAPPLREVSFEHCSALLRSPAGKHRMVVHEVER